MNRGFTCTVTLDRVEANDVHFALDIRLNQLIGMHREGPDDAEVSAEIARIRSLSDKFYRGVMHL